MRKGGRSTLVFKKKTSVHEPEDEDDDTKLLGKIKSQKEEEDGATDEDAEDGEEADEFYDFLEPMRNPDILLSLANRRLLDLEFVPGNKLLVEARMDEFGVEVYQIDKHAMLTTLEPIHVIKTGANSLSSILVASDKIYMGFMGSEGMEDE